MASLFPALLLSVHSICIFRFFLQARTHRCRPKDKATKENAVQHRICSGLLGLDLAGLLLDPLSFTKQ